SVLPGTDGATFPFWSPDGSAIAFFADGRLKRVDVAGGTPVPLANAASPRGGTWNGRGDIIFAPTTARALMVGDAAGGDARPVTELAPGQTSHRWPQFLPDGRRFLFESALSKERGLFLASLDGGPVRRVLADEVPVLFTGPDWLLVIRGGAL